MTQRETIREMLHALLSAHSYRDGENYYEILDGSPLDFRSNSDFHYHVRKCALRSACNISQTIM
jgi:hypothetical protein